MDFGIAGRKVLITGASTGIGRAVALGLAGEGAHVMLTSRDPGRLVAAVAAVRATGSQAEGVVADITSADGCTEVVAEALRHFQKIDILINNAGASRPLTADITDQQRWWDEAFALNFEAARRITEGLLPSMIEHRWGRIVNLTGAMTSAAANAAGPAKAALWSWSRSLSIQQAPNGITVNCVQPGRINTPQIVDRLLPTQESRQAEIDRGIPMGRFGEPDELAALVCFLASEPARYITGTQIPVDGGLQKLV